MKTTFIAIILYALTTTVSYAQPSALNILSYEAYKDAVANINIQDRKVSLEKLISLKNKGAVILDLRPKEDYISGHIIDSLHIGPNITKEKLSKLPITQDSTLVLYCNNSIEPTRMASLTHISIPQFVLLGYPNTYVLEYIWHDGSELDGIKLLKSKNLWQ